MLGWNPGLTETDTGDVKERVLRVLGCRVVMLEWHCGMLELEVDVAGLIVWWDGC